MSELMSEKFAFGRAATIMLFVLSFAQFMVALDYSIVYVALPEIAASLDINSNVSQWIFSAYGLFFAGFLLAGGRICDRYGSRRVFLVSIFMFGAASFLGGIAPDGMYLLMARALQGVSAAALQPAIIALISQNFDEGSSRAKALSIWGAVGASGLVAGVVIGGVLTMLSWRLIFIVNVPIALVCIWLGATYFLKKVEEADRAGIPIVSSILGTAAMLVTVLALTLIADYGLSNVFTYTTIGLSLVLMTTFLIAEWKVPMPLVARELRRISSLQIGCATSGLYMASVGAEFFLVTLLLQDLYGFDVLSVGLMFLPLSVTIILGNIVAGRMIGPYPAGKVLFFGFVLGFAGLIYIALFLGTYDYLFGVLPGLLLSGLGHGIIYTSKYVVGTRGIPDAQQGAASSLMVTSQYGAGSLALAILVLVMAIGNGSMSYSMAFAVTALFAIIGGLIALLDKPEAG